MKLRQFIVAIAGIIIIAGTVLAVNAMSGRQSLASSRRTRAIALEAQAGAALTRFPDSYDGDTKLLTGKLWATESADDLEATVKQASLTYGMSWLTVNDATRSRLAKDAVAALAINAGGGSPVLVPITVVVSVQGQFHQVTRYLESLQALGPLLVLSPVEFTFSGDSAIATLAISAIRLQGVEAGRSIGSDGSTVIGRIPMAPPTTPVPPTTISTTVTPQVPG